MRQADARDLSVHGVRGLDVPLGLDVHPLPVEALARYLARPHAQQHAQVTGTALDCLTRHASDAGSQQHGAEQRARSA